MGLKPVTIGACGALVGPKFKVTATRFEPGRPEETLLQDDFINTSVTSMAECMEGITRSLVIPKQQRVNSETGHNTRSIIVTGWQPGDFFSGLDQAFRTYPRSQEVIKNFGIERDQGIVQQGVLNAFEASNMTFNDYISGCRSVAGNPLSQGKVAIDQKTAKWIFERVRKYSNGGAEGKEALKELQAFVYQRGKGVVQSLKEDCLRRRDMRAFERMSRYSKDDPTIGNRFSQVGFSHYGPAGQALIRLPGIRKALADGIRDEIGFPRDHVLCPKVEGKDHPDRPLVNVAGSIAYQNFINDGHMTIDDLRAPYA